MITDLVKKYSPHFNHWPTWIIQQEAYELFLSENNLTPIEKFDDPQNTYLLKQTLAKQNLKVPAVISSQFSNLRFTETNYELRLASPMRLNIVTSLESLEKLLKDFWLEMYFDHAVKSKELKFYQSLPEVQFDWSEIKKGGGGWLSPSNYFPVRFQHFIHEGVLYVREIAELSVENSEKIADHPPKVSVKKNIIQGIPLSSGMASGHWIYFKNFPMQVKGKIIVLSNMGPRFLNDLAGSHPLAIILTTIPKTSELVSLKKKHLPIVYVSPQDLHLERNIIITVNGTLGTVETRHSNPDETEGQIHL